MIRTPAKLIFLNALISVSSLLFVSSLFGQEQGAEPLQDVASDMNLAAVHLGKLRTDQPTQTAQKSALKKLNELIAELEKRRAGNQGGSVNPNPTQPATDSVIRTGPGGMGKLLAERREGKQWAELPAKERERILQSLNEGFPSHYQAILERYFSRLADEKPIADGSPSADREKPSAGIDKTAPAKGNP